MFNERLFHISCARKNLTAIAIAREIGVHHSTFSRWTRGWYEVPLNYRSKIAEILETPEKELFPADKEEAQS